MSITVYKYASIEPRVTIEPDANSVQEVELMGKDTLTINFSVTEAVNFRRGDYCYFFGKLYQINKIPKRTLTAERNIQYALIMESELYDLGKTQFLFLDANNQFTKAIFDFRGTPRDYGDLLIYNLKRMYPTSDWKLGNVIEGDFITQSFSRQNCLEAIKTIVGLFNTEFLLEGKTINIFQRQTSSGITLRYGEALYSLVDEDQTNSNVITRLYVYGSTRNITNNYRNASTNLRIGSIDYLESNPDDNQVEDSVVFDGTTTDPKTGAALPEIYPHRTGTITSVDDPFNFYDSTIDFNLNDYLISGVTAQIVFNTGLLSGYTFDINAFNNTTKKISINQNTNEPNLIVPTNDLTAVVGDEYVFVNINMPQSYIDKAESDLRAAGQSYLDDHKTPARTYSGEFNYKWFRDNNKQFSLAQSIAIENDQLGINVITRIVSYNRNIRNPYLYSMQLADTVKPNSIIVQLINGL